MSPPESAKSLTPEEREQLEMRHTLRRIVELELDPVRGSFDAAHLREINRRIFQDLPGAGFEDVKPGEYRSPVLDGKDWMKNRGLSTVEGSFYVAYSSMDDAARERLDRVLESAKPDQLRDLQTEEFTAALAKLYVELDYIHPFAEGNSRTLRTFTKQLVNESGYELDWERFAASDAGRDMLYIARDLSVNQLAKPHLQHEASMRKVIFSADRLEGNRDLPDLLRDAVRPHRAVAFEKLAEAEALQKHPELHDAYRTLHAASAYVEFKLPGKPTAQQQTLDAISQHVQEQLNKGVVRDFHPNRGKQTREVDRESDRER